ncbi:hypothetical protein COU62_04435 [Candidatus Pacearchaeota archaeon CG10_big_fil_rev_8_21_14_0_10_35_219]|nr:DHH family phosphoesterase [Candidatus Pacearchaeota archaeon]OIO42086.1 MAG: hypothetical protein AUJ63_04035 [Candidatus Pacearchaeota archaeon CG1_02_35_32]PIO07240.1 MAG: hypothetical protein COU62_04435 [Candidatus Pacearchaeota archaeon CG10_big_fil_rev_8_21_14_0_10_35_219]PIY81191.1 MAG: hypothetical protein COY79_04075 [Candidatus Pacearchaeota archaeon CG_4_10_14_0_8_um_filter_35_169]PIZ79442.1 MAG: hypothetical protein COY00_04085 [Candidatus Pacearchaeota archaeon CG_4_10_14_0_2_u
MLEKIKEAISKIQESTKPIKVISHNDTDGITSAAIFSRALQRAGIKFSLEIVKALEEPFIKQLPEDHLLIFLDLASGSLSYLEKKNTDVIILDHHELQDSKISNNILMVNPQLTDEENISGAGICYLFAKSLSPQNIDLATLAVIGMVGDQLEKEPGKIYNQIIQDSKVTIKKGLLLYPATRPLDRVLEYSSSLYIPDVTGSFPGVVALLREAGLQKTQNGYKSLAELTDQEMSNLITAIMLKRIGETDSDKIVGNLYLIKFFNKQEDAREISASINACSRMGYPEISIGFCLGNKEMKKEAGKIYVEYKQNISSALKYINELNKIEGKNYTIINARDKIKDTIIGTTASIMSHSPLYPEGTIIVAMAYNEDKIKVSARLVGKKGRNVREVLTKATIPLKGEVGGHPGAAGCLISKEHEEEFTKTLKNLLEVDFVKIE